MAVFLPLRFARRGLSPVLFEGGEVERVDDLALAAVGLARQVTHGLVARMDGVRELLAGVGLRVVGFDLPPRQTCAREFAL